MLAANPELQIGPRFPPPLRRHHHQFADTFLIQRHKGIGRQNAARRINPQK